MSAGVNTLSPVAVLHGLAHHAALLDGNHLLAHELLSGSNLRRAAQAVENDIASIVALKVGDLLKISVDSQFDGASCKYMLVSWCVADRKQARRRQRVPFASRMDAAPVLNKWHHTQQVQRLSIPLETDGPGS